MTIPHRQFRHSLITIFADTSAGGPSDVLLQENLSAILQQDNSYILLGAPLNLNILLQQTGASIRQEDGTSYILLQQ